jgi:hypothetical protein
LAGGIGAKPLAVDAGSICLDDSNGMIGIPFEAAFLVVPEQIVANDGCFLRGSAKTDLTVHLDIIGLGKNGCSGRLSFGDYLPVRIDFLKEKPELQMRLDPKSVGGSAAKSGKKTDPALSLENEEDQALFAALKALRMDIAKENNIPPYVVFHDKTLIDMVLRKPLSLMAMSSVPGVGQSKLEKYGQVFLDHING